MLGFFLIILTLEFLMLSKTQMRVYSNKLTRKFPESQNVTILAIVQSYQSDRLQSRQDFLD